MLRIVLSLVSSLQIGARIKDAIERSVKKAVVIAIAAVVFLFAIAFGLVAAYQALIVYDFTSLEAAGIVAGALVALGLIVLAFLPLVSRPKDADAKSRQRARRRHGHDRSERRQGDEAGGPAHASGRRLRRRPSRQPAPLTAVRGDVPMSFRDAS